jgi:hypothetical protein
MQNSELNNWYVDSSYINNIEQNNYTIYTINTYDGNLQNLRLLSSGIDSISLTHSGFYGMTLDNSFISVVHITDYSTYEFVYMRDANIFNSTVTNIVNLEMSGSTFDFQDVTYRIPSYTSFNTNTIVYKVRINFDGSVGGGAVGVINIPPYFVPASGWYIEKVIVDALGMSSSDTSHLNIGLFDVDTTSGLDSTKTIAQLNNKVNVSDISNGGANGVKTSSLPTVLSMNAETNSINAGTVYLEITLKNTNYGTNND